MQSDLRTRLRWYRRRAVRTALAAAFLAAGIGGQQLATASAANAVPVVHYIGDGWFCSELSSWPYFTCYN